MPRVSATPGRSRTISVEPLEVPSPGRDAQSRPEEELELAWCVEQPEDEPACESGEDRSASAPDLFQPVIGFREWVLIGEDILSPLARTPWHSHPMRAQCLARCRGAGGLWRRASRHAGPAPALDCVCGIYALFAPQPPRKRDRLALVRGAVALWGRIEVHEGGMRAEFARVVALAMPSFPPLRTRVAMMGVAERLGVDLVDTRHLTEAALAYGRPLPPSLMPA